MANIVKLNNFTTTPQIDWLSLRILYLDNILKLGAGYDYKVMPYSTRTFKRVIEITDLKLNEVVATITDSPTSPTINENLILIKFHNKLLYQSDLKLYISNFCQQNNFKIVAISRLDIAIDFTSFANNLHPETFIKRFLKGSYIKKGRGNFKTNFKTREFNTIDTQANGKYGKTIIHEYLRFGSANNGLKYYLYNKSKELEQVKEKPYIRESWREFGHDEKKDVWRLEFSLTSSKIEFIETSESQPIKKDKTKIFASDNEVIDTETGEEIKIKKQKLKSLDCLDLEVLEKINASLINKYMVFYLNKNTGEVKNRAKKIILIKNLSKHIAYTCDDSLKDSTNTDKNFITNLRRTYEDLRHKDVYSLHTLEKLIFAQIQKRGLQKWADDRQILNFEEGNPYQYKGSDDEIKAFKRPKDLTDKAKKAKKFNKDD